MIRYFYILIICLFALPGRATHYYIDPGCGTPGDGTSPNCTGAATDPFDQWSDATIQAGDDFRQKCGTSYTGGVVNISAIGTSGNHIIIGAYNADGSHEDGGNEVFGQNCSGGLAKPIIRRTTEGTDYGISTATADVDRYIEFNSISAQIAGRGIHLSSNRNFVRYCYLWKTENGVSGGFSGESSDYNTVEYNLIDMGDSVDESGPNGDAIGMENLATYWTVQYNHITGYDHIGVFIEGGGYHTVQYNYIYSSASNGEDYCINTTGSTGNNTTENVVRYNYCKDAGTGLSPGGTNGEFYGNVFICNNPTVPFAAQGCINVLSPGFSYQPITGNKVYNNTVYDNDNQGSGNGLRIYSVASSAGAVSDNEFTNNIFVKVDDYCIEVFDNDAAGTIGTNYFYNNSCYDYLTNSYGYIYDGSLNTYTTASLFNARGDASGNIDTDSSLANPVSHQLWPDDSGDPVVGAGCDMNDSGSDCYDAAYTADETILRYTSDFTATPPSIVTEEQPVSWYIGAYAMPGATSPFMGAVCSGCKLN